MKKLLMLLICLLGCIAYCSCSNSKANEIQALQQNITDLESNMLILQNEKEQLSKDLLKIQEENAVISKELDEFKLAKEEEENKKIIQANDVDVKVIDMKKIPKDTSSWIFSNSVMFSIDIKNNTDKEIKGVQGVIEVQDMFGVKIMNLNCDFTGKVIKPGKKINNSELGFEINSFMDEHNKVYSTDFEDLIFIYTPTKIMFSDGSSKE